MSFTSREGHIFLKRNKDPEIQLVPEVSLDRSESSEFFQFIADHHNLFHKERLDFSGCRPFAPLIGEKVVLFPGTFSPWHEGHEACIANLPKGSQVAVIPDYNPWKDVRRTNLWHEACAIWKGVEKLSGLNISLYLGFLLLKEKNPTISWLTQIPFQEKWLLMGEDTFLNIHKWSQADEVLSELSGLYVCPRAENKETVLAQREEILSLRGEKSFEIVFLAPHPYQHYSSSYLREKKS